MCRERARNSLGHVFVGQVSVQKPPCPTASNSSMQEAEELEFMLYVNMPFCLYNPMMTDDKAPSSQ